MLKRTIKTFEVINIFTTHYSLFTIHFSLFTLRYSLFTIRYSLFIIHSSLFTIHANQGLNLVQYFRKALKGLHLNNRECNPRLTMTG